MRTLNLQAGNSSAGARIVSLGALALVLAACSAVPALAADSPAHSRLLLGVGVEEGVGSFDSGVGSLFVSVVPAPTVRMSYFLTERLELNGGATYQAVPYKFQASDCGGSAWNNPESFAFLDLTSRYNFTSEDGGFWFLAGGLVGGVMTHDVRGAWSHAERGSPAIGGKVQTGWGSWITPRVRWSFGLEYYMGMTFWQINGDTKPGPFGQLSLMLGVDFGID